MKTVRFVTTLFICLLSLDASAVDCCSSPEERTADNLARGAPADFTTYNERICIKEPSGQIGSLLQRYGRLAIPL